jgi:hypothetical protein
MDFPQNEELLESVAFIFSNSVKNVKDHSYSLILNIIDLIRSILESFDPSLTIM